jgi:hypothetical protein
MEPTSDMAVRLDRLEQLMRDGFQQVNERITAAEQGIHARIDRLETYVLEFRSESIRRFESLDSRLDILAATMHLMHGTMPILTKAMDDVQVRLGKLERAA